MIIVSKPVNDISTNSVEYLLDEKGNEKLFNSVIEAVEYLKEKGLTVKDIKGLDFKRVETTTK